MNAQYRRLSVLAFLLVISLSALSCRLFDLQVLRHEKLSALADDNTILMDWREPLRGQILDIRGNPLATSTPVKTVCADPSVMGKWYPEIARVLAPFLQTNESSIIKLISGPSAFLSNSFKDMESFATKLKQQPDELSAFLGSKLSDGTRQYLAAYQGGDTNLEQIRLAVLRDLNSIAKSEWLYTTQRFSRVTLRKQTKQLLELTPEGDNLFRLNRLLLEDAYPKEISKKQYIVLKNKVPIDEWDKIYASMTNLTFGLDWTKLKKEDRRFYNHIRRKSIFARDDQIRVYPSKRLAAHVIGFVDKSESQIGLSGIEAVFEKQLAGTRGWLKSETDIRKREMVPFCDQDVPPVNGLNAVLTLDAGLQHIVETALEEGMRKNNPISISCTVVRPRTGAILAMATLPNFDPNEPGKSPTAALMNRVISHYAEPGSTFKVVPVSAALNEQIVNLNTLFDCERGKFAFGGRILHDHEPYALLSVEGIITKSSNIGAAKVGIKLGEERLYQYIRNFGFGSKTLIPLPGEINGLVYPPKKWSKVSIAQIPMGHGVTATPLQMIMAMSAIANKGLLMRPMLVDRLVDENGKLVAQYHPMAVRQVITENAAREMVTALKTVPTKQGTAELAKLEHYTVAGKTGTAQKVIDRVYVKRYFSSFIGFFPADNPELCISVVLDDPSHNGYYGGRTAGPVFKQIAEAAANYLNVKPDIELEFDPEDSGSVSNAQ